MEENNITTTNEEQESSKFEEASEEFQSADTDQEFEDEDFGNFEEMYEESIKDVKVGGIVKGKVIQMNPDSAVIDIGYKSEGQVPLNQFTDAQGNCTLKVGDEVDVFLERYEDENGNIQLSRIKAERLKVWEDIKRIYDEELSIPGTITGKVKGGLSVDIGVPAFLPGSQIDLKPIRNLDKLIGETFDFRVLKHNQKRNNVVISRRALLEKEREALKEVLLTKLQEGAVLEGIVKNITDYGAFIDLGGLDGLLHITDISWGRVNHPSERLTVGSEVTVKIIKYDEEKQRVSLGMKQLKEDPWASAGEKYPEGTKVKGKVLSIKDYGAFVEIEEGIESLVHVSEMSWTKKIKHPSQVVSVGDEIEAIVLSVDIEKRRISLGMKQVEPNPWDTLIDKYPIGTKIEGEIKNITDFGIFVGIESDIDGLVHISDISWSKRLKHPGEEFTKGQTIQAVVLNLDKENQRFSLGIKQLQEDPWETISKKVIAGDNVNGKVTNLTDFGAFVELEDGVEGLVHISEVTADKNKKPEDVLKVGDQITAKVLNINYDDRKIALSIKGYLEEKEKLETGEYMSDSFQKGKVCLGEILQQATSASPTADADTEASDEKDEKDVAAAEAEIETKADEVPEQESETTGETKEEVPESAKSADPAE
ncbi:MAG TPA: 30S ribosomal protein S1 [Proteobacteria bacterium]|nr:30S ribosomal protein S1 [Pseudomonadota bacterium]